MSLHKSVLLKEAIDGLQLQIGDVYLDATAGSGGHMEEVWKRMGSNVTICGIDVDDMSISITRERLSLLGLKPRLAVLNFRNIEKAPEMLGIKSPNKILFDLGWSADQFYDESGEGRGFSFNKEEPLIMTLKSDRNEDDVTAHEIVNNWSEESLSTIIYGYGEERYSRRIAKAIVEYRSRKPIETSLELAEIIKKATPVFYRFGRIHPATRTFQALRIAVNDELRALEEGLKKSFEILAKNGRIAVITFHSLEDRIVKNFFNNKKNEGVLDLINKKPIIPNKNEILINPRSRSAKLRIISKK